MHTHMHTHTYGSENTRKQEEYVFARVLNSRTCKEQTRGGRQGKKSKTQGRDYTHKPLQNFSTQFMCVINIVSISLLTHHPNNWTAPRTRTRKCERLRAFRLCEYVSCSSRGGGTRLYIYVCIYVYIYVYIYICIYIHMYIHICIYIYAYTYIFIPVYIHVYTYIYMYVHVCIRIYIYIFKISHIYISMYIQNHWNMYIHTFVYITYTHIYRAFWWWRVCPFIDVILCVILTTHDRLRHTCANAFCSSCLCPCLYACVCAKETERFIYPTPTPIIAQTQS